mmetsp:Transcript_79340/g.229476  ORF Transcript_79340/g.229476 Transcript_79340/m.229476 type:complete len:227 (+) Transcript_79340:694-1374(+)
MPSSGRRLKGLAEMLREEGRSRRGGRCAPSAGIRQSDFSDEELVPEDRHHRATALLARKRDDLADTSELLGTIVLQQKGVEVDKGPNFAEGAIHQPRIPATHMAVLSLARRAGESRGDAAAEVGHGAADANNRLHHRACDTLADALSEAYDTSGAGALHRLSEDVQRTLEALREGLPGLQHPVPGVLDLLGISSALLLLRVFPPQGHGAELGSGFPAAGHEAAGNK